MAELGPGSELDGYRIEEQLGRGGMGVVYRARQLELARDVAVKVIAPERVADEQARRRFLSEARAAAAVEHANVLPVYGAGIAGGRAYIVMRYVPGDDLRMLVRLRGPLAPERAAAVVLALGDALDAIHRSGFIHRDVKPANVLIDRDGHVYLSDFGLAKEALASAGLTESDRWVGSLDFAAPEQIRGGRVDARADIYALGGVLHYMLTAAVPYDRPSDEAKLWAHLADVPPTPSVLRPELPRALDAVVERAMAKRPEDRYRSAGDAGRAARAAAGGPDPGPERSVASGAARAADAATLPGLLGSATRARSTHGTRRALVAGAVLALVAAGAAAALLAGGGDGGAARVRHSPVAQVSKADASRGPHRGPTIRGVAPSPRDLTVAQGDVWIISAHRSRVVRLSAATMEPHGHRPLVGRGALSIASDGRTVWVAVARRDEVAVIDAKTGRQREPLRFQGGEPILVAAGAGGLWVAAQRRGPKPDLLYRFSAAGVRLGRTTIPQDTDALTTGGGLAWVTHDVSARLIGYDRSLRAGHRRYLRTRAKNIAYGDGYVWLAEDADGIVGRFNPDTRILVQPGGVAHPAGIVHAAGRVFVVSNTESLMYVLDPKRPGRVVTKFELPTNPWAVAAGSGHVWVTGMARGTLTRIDY